MQVGFLRDFPNLTSPVFQLLSSSDSLLSPAIGKWCPSAIIVFPTQHLVHCSHCQKSSLSKTESERMDPAVSLTSDRESPGVTLRQCSPVISRSSAESTWGTFHSQVVTCLSLCLLFMKKGTPTEGQTSTLLKGKFSEVQIANE